MVVLTFSVSTMFGSFIGHLRPFENGGIECKMPNILSIFSINWAVPAKSCNFFSLTSFLKNSRASARDGQNVLAASLNVIICSFPRSMDTFCLSCYVKVFTFLKFMQFVYIIPFNIQILE